MQRKFRLSKSNEFKRVRRFGKSYAHPLIVFIALRGGDEQAFTRFAFSAGRSVGNAVQRNRAKRLMRAAVQSFLGRIAPGWEVVLLARKPLPEAHFTEVQQALAGLLKRSRLLMENHGDEH